MHKTPTWPITSLTVLLHLAAVGLAWAIEPVEGEGVIGGHAASGPSTPRDTGRHEFGGEDSLLKERQPGDAENDANGDFITDNGPWPTKPRKPKNPQPKPGKP